LGPAAMSDPLDLGQDAGPRSLGPGGLQDPRDFDLRPLQSSNLGQTHLSSPKFLGSGRGCQIQVNGNNNKKNNKN